MEDGIIPQNELERLAVLKRLNILDSIAENRFDRYTRLAAQLFQVPYSFIGLVDEDRQWFKSSQGISLNEIPRALSICAHTILQNDLFEIQDTLKDERFANHPLTKGSSKIRFYAAVPIAPFKGLNLGTFCILDSKPRILSPEQKQSLKDLASLASDEMILFIDDLTGLTNRRGFNMIAQPVISASHRSKGISAVIILDLDHFKEINDKYGHQEGDRALRLFAQVMREEFRDSDVISRLGGDEFSILLANSSEKDAKLSLGRLQTKLDLLMESENSKYRLSFSAGVIETVRQKAPIVDEMLAYADDRLYEDKASKRLDDEERTSDFVKNLVNDLHSFS